MSNLKWDQLNENELTWLDNYLIEKELVNEHQRTASFLQEHICRERAINMVDFVNLVVNRRTWLTTNPWARAVVDKNVDEQAWLEARRKGVTATEVAKLAKGQPAERLKMLHEKSTGERSFFGNKYTQWGLEREPVICSELSVEYEFQSSDMLFHAAGNDRHLATPDAIHTNKNGLVTIAEIKTSKNELDPGTPFFQRSGYMDQMQWQMYVMGEQCNRCLFAWEQHDNEWVLGADGVERPTPIYFGRHWIERDQKRIDYLISVADEFLAELEWSL